VTWTPIPPAERFAEALGLVALAHTPLGTNQRALAVGASASPLLEAAARYPTFTELVSVGGTPPAKDRRSRTVSSLKELPEGWRADVIAVALMGDLEQTLVELAPRTAPNGIVVVACDRFAAGPHVRDLARRHWKLVTIFREFLPDPSVFILAGSRQFSRTRAIPGWARHLSDQYLPNLFRLARDEYAYLYGHRSAS
jgi:hypothetical protein